MTPVDSGSCEYLGPLMSDLLQLLSMLALPASVLLLCRRANRRHPQAPAIRT